MTGDEIKSLLDNIVPYVNEAADFVGTLDPALIPLIAIGKAVDKQVPGIAKHIADWINGSPPTEADRADLAGKLAVLNDPNAP